MKKFKNAIFKSEVLFWNLKIIKRKLKVQFVLKMIRLSDSDPIF